MFSQELFNNQISNQAYTISWIFILRNVKIVVMTQNFVRSCYDPNRTHLNSIEIDCSIVKIDYSDANCSTAFDTVGEMENDWMSTWMVSTS